MQIKWLIWKFILKLAARQQGFLDPVSLLVRFNSFAQPSEVLAPLELLRAGAQLHARGLINSQVIQHNLDWVWPYWAERQFDPLDASFIPRAFSISHINLTHRNWTAVGIPGVDTFVLVDPRGVVTPFYDSWSVDGWLFTENGIRIIPSRLKSVTQKMITNYNLQVDTDMFLGGARIMQHVRVEFENGIPVCLIDYSIEINTNGTFAVTLRPYNPEGISFINSIRSICSGMGLYINKKHSVFFTSIPDAVYFSNYNKGDVYHLIGSDTQPDENRVVCDIGMATAAATFNLSSGTPRKVEVRIPLTTKKSDKSRKSIAINSASDAWHNALNGCCTCELPYKNFQYLYNAALHTLLLHSPDTVYAGPYTYKRFWFRDAAFIIQALLFIGRAERCAGIINGYFKKQKSNGYFESQEGEWDSNGQALWSMAKYCQLTNTPPPADWIEPILKGAEWICKKRIKRIKSPFNGLFPPGLSAEHLGPNDYYFWDDFWGVAGLLAAASLLSAKKDANNSLRLMNESKDFMHAINTAIDNPSLHLRNQILSASPNRRPDSGAVGSLVSSYPLQLFKPGDSRVNLTADYLYKNCCINSAFYHDISHSGINPYLTLHIAQTFLRNSDLRHAELTNAIAGIASPTGQWPEAIHPQLGTGCMGDGQHVWAAAEWMMIIRNIFIREENETDTVYLCSGITREHLLTCRNMSLGPVFTKYGKFTIGVEADHNSVIVTHHCERNKSVTPEILITLCGCSPVRTTVEKSKTAISLDCIDL